MRSFRDTENRLWTLQIHTTAIKRVRALVGVDLVSLFDEKTEALTTLLGDPVAMVDVLYVLVMEQAEKEGISDEQFGRAMGGDCLESATQSFLDELVEYFPDVRRRDALKKVISTSRRAQEMLMDKLEEKVKETDFDSILTEYVKSSTDSRGSSASTPET